MAAFTEATWTPGVSESRPTTTVGSDERQVVVSTNALLTKLSSVLAALGGAELPITTTTLSRGTTVTLATSAAVISVNAVSAVVAAQTAEVFGALGTIPTLKWGVIKVMRVLAGTTTYVSGADNYTTGYATEALAIAAMPATTASRVAVGYITVYASHASGWVAGTDALEGGTGGNPAGETNYYSFDGVADTATWASVLQVGNKAGDLITSTVG